jgi:hypothetical protein
LEDALSGRGSLRHLAAIVPAALVEDVVAIGGATADRSGIAMKHFDAIIIGAGQAGPSMAAG